MNLCGGHSELKEHVSCVPSVMLARQAGLLGQYPFVAPEPKEKWLPFQCGELQSSHLQSFL